MIYRLGSSIDDDFPQFDWPAQKDAVDQWMALDDAVAAGASVNSIDSSSISMNLPLTPEFPRVDCVSLVPGLAISQSARTVFDELAVGDPFYLPFCLNDETWFRPIVGHCLDCLNRGASDLEFFADSNRVKRITKYVFRQEMINDIDIFTIPEQNDGMFFWVQTIFITDLVRERLETAQLIGFRFDDR